VKRPLFLSGGRAQLSAWWPRLDRSKSGDHLRPAGAAIIHLLKVGNQSRAGRMPVEHLPRRCTGRRKIHIGERTRPPEVIGRFCRGDRLHEYSIWPHSKQKGVENIFRNANPLRAHRLLSMRP